MDLVENVESHSEKGFEASNTVNEVGDTDRDAQTNAAVIPFTDPVTKYRHVSNDKTFQSLKSSWIGLDNRTCSWGTFSSKD